MEIIYRFNTDIPSADIPNSQWVKMREILKSTGQ